MFTHSQIWAAIDKLAEGCQCDVADLAARAGLDRTTLCASKRVSSNGRERWPSLETLAKLLSASQVDLVTFANIVADEARSPALSMLDTPVAGSTDDLPAAMA